MEQKMKCPYCGRCIGFVQSTDDENSVFSITKSELKENCLSYAQSTKGKGIREMAEYAMNTILQNPHLINEITQIADLTANTAYIFSNDDGSVRTYFGSRKIFDGWKKRHKSTNYNIHFHGLRHTFSNMLFEMNENPKVIQQLLGHRDVKTTVHTNNRLHKIKFLSGENQNTKVNTNIYKN